MNNELQKKDSKENKKDNTLGMVLYASLGAVIFFVAELYLMIAMPALLPAIAIAGLAIVGCTYLIVSTIIKYVKKKEIEHEEQYNNLIKSEKASYLLIRKYFEEIEEQLSMLEDKIADPFQEIIAAQKATAKVTINRNKENTDALMNSNDKLLELVFEMEGKLNEVSDVVTAGFDKSAQGLSDRLMQKQQDLANQLREMELNLRSEILQTANKISAVPQQMVMAVPPQMPTMPQTPVQPVQESEETPELDFENFELEELGDLPEFTPLEADDSEPIKDSEDLSFFETEEIMQELAEEPILEAQSIIEEEPIAEEPIVAEDTIAEEEPVAEEVPPMPDLSDPNKMMSADDIAALFANMGESSAQESASEAEEIPVVEEEPVAEEVPPMPDLSDPNKMMSADDIAALFANMGESSAQESAPEAAEIPVVEEEPVAEEVPPMPDLSDPNKMMSPDDIAALFANLT
ncbi:MAG: hypothetical protein PUD20_11400 [bacterium]|nr:hypothetical protein [bacterium]